MKKLHLIWMLLFACIMSLGMSACAGADEGESWEDWILRNTINGPAWRVYQIKENKQWVDCDKFWFEIKFSASHHNFKSTKFYYVDGVADESTREEYDGSDDTAYQISGKIIEGTVGGSKYFRMELTEKVTEKLVCKLHFYKENKTYEVVMMR